MRTILRLLKFFRQVYHHSSVPYGFAPDSCHPMAKRSIRHIDRPGYGRNWSRRCSLPQLIKVELFRFWVCGTLLHPVYAGLGGSQACQPDGQECGPGIPLPQLSHFVPLDVVPHCFWSL